MYPSLNLHNQMLFSMYHREAKVVVDRPAVAVETRMEYATQCEEINERSFYERMNALMGDSVVEQLDKAVNKITGR